LPHITLYRKYRSQTFEELVGQEHITKTLQAGIETGRMAQAYLFTGPRGTGKTSAARILAKCLNCETGPTPTPCGTCHLCTTITAGQGGDVVELDAASESGVDEIRELIERANYAPMEGRYKVYIIDEVHDLSGKAFDAFLKTIEEPPPHVVFILATTEFNKVPVTIRSRCQRYEFHRGSLRDLVGRLEYVCNAEGIEFDGAALGAIARMADGGYRDALTLLEQAVLTTQGKLTYEEVMRQLGLVDEQQIDQLIECAMNQDIRGLMNGADQAVRMGKEPRAILESLLLRISELTHAAYETDSADPERQAANHSLAVRIGERNLLAYRAILAEAHRDIRDVSLPRLWLELSLLRLCEPQPQSQPIEPPSHRPQQQAARPQPPQTARVNGSSSTTSAHPTPQTHPEPPGEPPANPAAGWLKAVELLSNKSPAAGKILEGTYLARHEGKVGVVAFQQRFQLDRVTAPSKEPGKPNQAQVIHTWFRWVMRDDSWTLKMELAQPEVEAGYAAVQLPAEGEHLAGLVEELFEVKPE
jgi:DNA polymerase-3 subunit gamma/tau